MSWWRHFDAAELERDFARIGAAGLDCVRIFLLWEDFQPAPDRVRELALGRLVSVADAARDAGLALIPTLFTGHMSGVNWLPAWAVEPPDREDLDSPAGRFRIVANGRVIRALARNWYADEAVAEAQARLAETTAQALRDHPALWAFDLGNESSNCCVPPSRRAGVEWLDRIATSIRAADPHVPITIGLHMEDLCEDRRLGPREAGSFCDFLCMHGYPIYADFAESPADERLLPYLGLLTRWLGQREVLFAEFGAPAVPAGEDLEKARRAAPRATLLDEESAASYTGRALEALLESGFLGALLWCYADYAEALWGGPPLDEAAHERWFGLWRADGSPKPAVARIGSCEGLRPPPPKAGPAWIDVGPDEFYERPNEHLRRLYGRYLESCG